MSFDFLHNYAIYEYKVFYNNMLADPSIPVVKPDYLGRYGYGSSLEIDKLKLLDDKVKEVEKIVGKEMARKAGLLVPHLSIQKRKEYFKI